MTKMTAHEQANEMLDGASLDEPTAEEVLEALRKIVNGATRTMGTYSTGVPYAHISQDILDLGRAVLVRAGVPNVSDRR